MLAIDQAVQEKDGQRVVVGKTATLELAPHQAEALTLAQQDGTLALSLRSMSDASRGGPELAEPPKRAVAEPPKTDSDNVIVVYKGITRETYSCNPECSH